MPNTKSAGKAMRQAARRHVTNLNTKAKVKDTSKKVRKAIEAKSADEATAALRDAMAALDKAAKKGVIHKNNASRKKSRMAKAIAKLSQ